MILFFIAGEVVNETLSACACAHVAEEQPHYSSVLNNIVNNRCFSCAFFQSDQQNTQNSIHFSRVIVGVGLVASVFAFLLACLLICFLFVSYSSLRLLARWSLLEG